MDLFEQVSEDIKNAMKAKDKVALETLRNVKKFFFFVYDFLQYFFTKSDAFTIILVCKIHFR